MSVYRMEVPARDVLFRTDNGQRFLLPQPVDSDGDSLITAIVNWPRLLRN